MEETRGGLASIPTKDNHHRDTEQAQRTTEFVSVNLCENLCVSVVKKRFAGASSRNANLAHKRIVPHPEPPRLRHPAFGIINSHPRSTRDLSR